MRRVLLLTVMLAAVCGLSGAHAQTAHAICPVDGCGGGTGPFDFPVASLSGTPLQGLEPLDVAFNTAGTGCEDPDGNFRASAGTLDFGDGSDPVAGGSAVHHTYAAGSYTATVSVSCLGNTGTASVQIDVGAASQIDAPSSVDFGSLLVGASADRDITITVQSGGNYQLASGFVDGPNAGDFSPMSSTCDDVAPGNSCAISFRFRPSAHGAESATFHLTDNSVTRPTSVDLTGTGLDPQVTPSPAALDFGSQLAGTTSEPVRVTLGNTGSDPLHLTGFSIGKGFKASGFGTCTRAAIPVGGSCSFTVRFAPAKADSFLALLILHSDATNGGSIELRGTALPNADVGVSVGAPGHLASGDRFAYSLTVRNDGPSPAQNVVVEDTLPSSVRFVSAAIPTGGKCNLPAVGETGGLICRFTSLKKGASRTVQVTVDVVAAGGTLSNTATATSTTPDAHLSNNSATAQTLVG
jgi:uncharacterized repeat protein (TIGR01451 family)